MDDFTFKAGDFCSFKFKFSIGKRSDSFRICRQLLYIKKGVLMVVTRYHISENNASIDVDAGFANPNSCIIGFVE